MGGVANLSLTSIVPRRETQWVMACHPQTEVNSKVVNVEFQKELWKQCGQNLPILKNAYYSLFRYSSSSRFNSPNSLSRGVSSIFSSQSTAFTTY